MTSKHLVAIFSLPPLQKEKEVIEYSERFLWGDLRIFAERLWLFLQKKHTPEQMPILHDDSYSKNIEKYDEPLLKKLKQKIEQEETPFWEKWPDDFLVAHCGAFSLFLYKNGATFLNCYPILVPSFFERSDTVECRKFLHTWMRELLDILQPDMNNRSVIYTSDLHQEDLNAEFFLRPFSIDAYIQKMRTNYPDHERTLMHDFTQDWDSFFWYSSHPFFIVDQRQV